MLDADVCCARAVDQLVIQQQIELLQQQQQHIQATHQQYVNMGMIPPNQAMGQGFNTLQPAMTNMSPQTGFQFPAQLPQQNVNLAPPTQPLSHRRNQSALPNMGMGPPPAPSSGASGSAFGSFDNSQGHGRENAGARGGRGGAGGGHQRRHSLALADAKKAAEIAQQKRTTSGFQFPAPGASGSAEKPDDEVKGAAASSPSEALAPQNTSYRGGRGGGHGRSQSMAVGANGRGGGSGRGGHFSTDSVGQSGDFPRRGGHGRTGSRNFDSNWRNQNQNQNQGQDQTAAGTGQNQGFQPGHRSRASVNHQSISSIGSFQYPGQPQLMQLPGQIMMPGIYPGQQLTPMQISQLQALQVAQMNGQHLAGLQASQHGPQMGGQQPQQQQRKTLFTPYLPQATLPALLGDGQLVSGILRVNKKNRSDAYVSTQDGLLDADIFICGSKDRNRALEGDLVAVELLDVDEVWSQKREKEEKKKRKDITDTRSGSTAGNNQGGANGDDAGNGEGGIRRRGSLRQRPTQKKNDDVEVEGQSLLLVEEEEINDDQKPLYAGHIVAVIERVAGQMFSGTLGLLRPSSQATKEKQEAERAARDGGGRQHDNRQQEKPKIVWFKPTDKRVPLIAIPTEQAPRDFVEKHQDYADQIFVACIKRWPITSLHPFGTLVEKLGKMGDLKIETDALLRDNNFGSDDFSEAVLRSVNLQDWSVEKEDEVAMKARRDFREEKVVTLDLDGSNVLGTGFHVKSLPDGKIEIGVHVPDITHFVKPNSLVDREAKKRGTAVHLMNRFCALLPPKISTDVCSLVSEKDRLTVSVVFHVNPHSGAVAEGDIWIGKAIVKSSGKLTLQQIDEAIAGNAGFKHDIFQAKDVQILNVGFSSRQPFLTDSIRFLVKSSVRSA